MSLRSLGNRHFRHFSVTFPRYNVGFNDPFTDSSINTMNKILTILHDAHAPKKDELSTENLLQEHLHSPEKFQERLHASLGSDVFECKALQVLIELQLENNVDIFRDCHPKSTRHILEQYISIFKDRHIRSKTAAFPTMAEIGREMERIPSLLDQSLEAEIKSTALVALRDITITSARKDVVPFHKITVYPPLLPSNPDPLIIRKSLDGVQEPETLLSVMVDDPAVLAAFTTKSKSEVSANILRNFMEAQSMHGALAFSSLIKKKLLSVDPKRSNGTHLERLHFPIGDSTARIDELKAIIASRSKLTSWLAWYSPYKFALSKLESTSKADLTSIMARMFDRYFSVRFMRDPDYCDRWVDNFVQFFFKNCEDQKIFDDLHWQSIQDFKDIVMSSKFLALSSRWTVSKPTKRSNDLFSFTYNMKVKKKGQLDQPKLGDVNPEKFSNAHDMILAAKELASHSK